MGRDLISAAAVRAQVSQIEKYNQAVNTFKGKYGYLPGDIPNNDASRFGFLARSNLFDCGNGSISTGVLLYTGVYYLSGKPLLFWRDLSDAKLINGSFGKDLLNDSGFYPLSNFKTYLPNALINQASYVYVYDNNNNYFGLSAPISNDVNGFNSKTSITVQQAYNIDKKIDDGIPLNGNVTAVYVNSILYEVHDPQTDDITTTSFGGVMTANDCQTVDCTSNTPDQNCFVNNQTYNISYPNNVNCALSFKFQ